MKLLQGWGVTGWSNAWTTLGSDVADDDDGMDAEDGAAPARLRGYGIRRTVDPGVTYAPRPDVAGVYRWHAKRRTNGRVFEMPWPEEMEPVTRSIVDLHTAITARRRSLTADDPDLAALDTAIDGIVNAAAGLHAADASLGFVQPDSCRVGTWHDGTPFVALPDVGFAWDKRSGLMKPRWITEPPVELLFEQGADRRNEEYLAEITRSTDGRDLRQRAEDAATRELTDVKILARLLAVALVGVDEVRRWCGNKKCLLALPGKDVATDTQAEIWDMVIAPALAGQVRTCGELRLRLAVHRPSSHFLHVPPPPPWSGWPLLRQAGMAAVAAACIAILWSASGPVMNWIAGKPAPFCRNVAATDPLYDKLFELEKARKASLGDVADRPAFWMLLRECLQEHADPARCGADCLDPLVADWARQAEDEGQAVRARLRSRPRPTQEEIRDIAAALVFIRESTAVLKRRADPAVVQILERELRLRGGELPREERPIPN